MKSMLRLIACFFLTSFFALAIDADYPLVFRNEARNHTNYKHIPKIAHFVLSFVGDGDWTIYLAVRSAYDRLGCTQIFIWVPRGEGAKGGIWDEMMKIPGTVQKEIDMPDTVYGNPITEAAHVSDVVRYKALYQYGGIYMDTNLVAFRSSDDVIYDPKTKSTVVASETDMDQGQIGICNALIMTKPGAPFLRRWMQNYRRFHYTGGDMLHNSQGEPSTMVRDGDPDVTILAQRPRGWFYPNWYHRDIQWFGKTFWDVNLQYGMHVWRFDGYLQAQVDPYTVRTVDTPMFCGFRKLFDNVGNDGYYAMEQTQNPNCSSVFMQDLTGADDTPFAAYEMMYDREEIKWVDTSGNHLHGWAVKGTALDECPGAKNTSCRQFKAGSYANLPMPVDYDVRVGSIQMRLRIDNDAPPDRDISLIDFTLFDWVGQPLSEKLNVVIRRIRDKEPDKPAGSNVIVAQSIILHDDEFHDITISWDYRSAKARRQMTIDGEMVVDEPAEPEPAYINARYIWINAREDRSGEHKWHSQDFSGSLEYIRFYSSVVSPMNASARAPMRYNYPIFDSLANKRNTKNHWKTYEEETHTAEQAIEYPSHLNPDEAADESTATKPLILPPLHFKSRNHRTLILTFILLVLGVATVVLILTRSLGLGLIGQYRALLVGAGRRYEALGSQSESCEGSTAESAMVMAKPKTLEV